MASPPSVAFLGPPGTFTEEALLTQEDYAAAAHLACPSILDVLEAVDRGEVALGFVPMENAIEGTINATLDALLFDFDLLVQREVVLDVHLHLMAAAGTRLEDVARVTSIPAALAQCERFLHGSVRQATRHAANSTAEAAQQLAEHPDPQAAVVATRMAADLYGLRILVEDIEDHPDNKTRFVAVARAGVPAPTGHDRTSIVCFQHADRPGTLHGILGEFAARNINLTKLESRPTKQALGEYCFVIDLEGHIADEVVGDCLKTLHASLAGVKFLGSYPAAGDGAPDRRREADESWRAAGAWLEALRRQVKDRPAGTS